MLFVEEVKLESRYNVANEQNEGKECRLNLAASILSNNC